MSNRHVFPKVQNIVRVLLPTVHVICHSGLGSKLISVYVAVDLLRLLISASFGGNCLNYS